MISTKENQFYELQIEWQKLISVALNLDPEKNALYSMMKRTCATMNPNEAAAYLTGVAQAAVDPAERYQEIKETTRRLIDAM